MKIHPKHFQGPQLAKCTDPDFETFVFEGRKLLTGSGDPVGEVEVELQGKWYVLRGQVDCHRTRAQLFRLVPRIDGAQWIVDHIRVGGAGEDADCSAPVAAP